MPAHLLRRAAVPALAGLLLVPAASPAAAKPRVLDVRLAPQTVHQGERTRARVVLSTPGQVRVSLDLKRGGRLVRVWLKLAPATKTRVSVALPRSLQTGRYRVSTVAIDGRGVWSRTVTRTLRVLPRR
jgi:hypothetical protein